MAGPHKPFPKPIQRKALKRQRGKCASCGERIFEIGKGGAEKHTFGEGAEGHHLIPHQLDGPLTLNNCVVLCKACHYSVHRGGHWKYTEQYDSVKDLPMAKRITVVAKWYRHYR